MNIFLEILGWIGAVAVLVAYFLLAAKKLASDSYTYHGMNILGSVLLAIYAFWKGAGASILVNVVWLLIGISAVFAAYRAGRSWRQG